MDLRRRIGYILEPFRKPQKEMRQLGQLQGRAVQVSVEALRSHAYIVGGTGTGKSRLLRLLIEQDIAAGHGLCLIDPHGDLCDALIGYLATLPDTHPALSRTVLIDPTAPDWAVGFNPLDIPEGEEVFPHVLELLNVFEKLWGDSWGARMEDLMRNSFITLAEQGRTLLDVPRLLTDEAFRDQMVEGVRSPAAKSYWEDRFGALTARTRAEWVESTLNKVSTFISDPWIRDMVGQMHSTVRLRQWMDDGVITLVNLAKGRLKRNSDLVGAMFVAKIQEAALSRVDLPETQRRGYRLIVDEFQNYATRSFEEILSEARKYGLCLMMANQTLTQLERTLLASVLGNCQAQVYFRCNRHDAETLARQAFRATGKQMKYKTGSGPSLFSSDSQSNPVFIPVGEEMEGYINFLLDLSPRQALLNIRGEGAPVPFRTADAPNRATTSRADALRSRFLAKAARSRMQVRAELLARAETRDEDEPNNYWRTP
jgi:hypothetical protein